MEKVSTKMETGGMLREQWGHGDKGAEDERKREVVVEKDRYRHT